MNTCCEKYKAAAISDIHYCSADLWNSTLSFPIDGYKIIRFCPECGLEVNSIETVEDLIKYQEMMIKRMRNQIESK